MTRRCGVANAECGGSRCRPDQVDSVVPPPARPPSSTWPKRSLAIPGCPREHRIASRQPGDVPCVAVNLRASGASASPLVLATTARAGARHLCASARRSAHLACRRPRAAIGVRPDPAAWPSGWMTTAIPGAAVRRRRPRGVPRARPAPQQCGRGRQKTRPATAAPPTRAYRAPATSPAVHRNEASAASPAPQQRALHRARVRGNGPGSGPVAEASLPPAHVRSEHDPRAASRVPREPQPPSRHTVSALPCSGCRGSRHHRHRGRGVSTRAAARAGVCVGDRRPRSCQWSPSPTAHFRTRSRARRPRPPACSGQAPPALQSIRPAARSHAGRHPLHQGGRNTVGAPSTPSARVALACRTGRAPPRVQRALPRCRFHSLPSVPHVRPPPVRAWHRPPVPPGPKPQASQRAHRVDAPPCRSHRQRSCTHRRMSAAILPRAVAAPLER